MELLTGCYSSSEQERACVTTYRHVHVAIFAHQLLLYVCKGLSVVLSIHQTAEHAGSQHWQLMAEPLHSYFET